MTAPVRIPADVDMADRVLGPLTARQLAILSVTGVVLYLIWSATRTLLPLPVFLALAVPVAVAVAVLALGRRDGVGMDTLMLAAIRQRLTPRLHVAAPEGVHEAPAWLIPGRRTPRWGRRGSTNHATGGVGGGGDGVGRAAALRLPARAVTDTGVIDLGTDGLAIVGVASTVNFALRTPDEQEALVAIFGRWLHSLTAPVQILIRTERVDLTTQIAALREDAGGLPHPALEAAALEHADYIAQLGHQTDLLRRQVLLVLREPTGSAGPPDGLGGAGVFATLGGRRRTRAGRTGRGVETGARRAAQARLVRRLGEAVELLAPAGITLTPLDAGQATTVLAAACNPDTLRPPSTRLAGADDVITTATAAESASAGPAFAEGTSFFAQARTSTRRRTMRRDRRDTEDDAWNDDTAHDEDWDGDEDPDGDGHDIDDEYRRGLS